MRLQEIYCLVSDAIHCLDDIDTASERTYGRLYDEALLRDYIVIIRKLKPLQIVYFKDAYLINWILIPVQGDFQPQMITKTNIYIRA